MHRPRSTGLVLFTLAMAVVLSTAGCSSSQEEQLLSNYFRASRMRDNTTLGNIAMVSFSPAERGVVQSFSVESISEEQRRPMQAREYALELQTAEAADKEFSGRKQTYQDENLEAIERVLEAERLEEDVRRADREVQEAWTTWRTEMAEYAQQVSEARAKLDEARIVAEASTFSPGGDAVDVTQYEGEIALKNVTIAARVRTPDDQEVDQRMVVTLERAELTGSDGTPLNGRWMITRIEDAG